MWRLCCASVVAICTLWAAPAWSQVILGAEAGSKEQQTRIKKFIDVDENIELALRKVYDRGIQTGTTWIIGYPGEDRASMMETIKKAAEMKYKFPGSASDIFPFRPIPGSADWDETVKLGMPTPKTLDDWGGCLEYKVDVQELGNSIPNDVLDVWRRYTATSSFYDGTSTRARARCARPCARSPAGA